ncbi:MAG: RusA family crossover junction endodeoxyribonuclease [Clostridiales bacterium]|jgi:Holliday junction resolvase RusA-like endonuclease|nr:RusA family crossover junction endodeoxyribonuclease [Clostridiales bacterium]
MTSATTQTLVISGRLPGRNEAERAARAHWSRGARLKAEFTELVHWHAVAGKIKPVKGLANIAVAFYEKDGKRDADNVIGGGLKYVLDGLKAAGVIKDDSQKYVDLTVAPIRTDKTNPRVEIKITGVI